MRGLGLMLQNKNRFMLRIIAAFMGAFMFQLTLSQAASIYDPKHSWRTIEAHDSMFITPMKQATEI